VRCDQAQGYLLFFGMKSYGPRYIYTTGLQNIFTTGNLRMNGSLRILPTETEGRTKDSQQPAKDSLPLKNSLDCIKNS
jgi:hypothetical protein